MAPIGCKLVSRHQGGGNIAKGGVGEAGSMRPLSSKTALQGARTVPLAKQATSRHQKSSPPPLPPIPPNPLPSTPGNACVSELAFILSAHSTGKHVHRAIHILVRNERACTSKSAVVLELELLSNFAL